MRPLMWSFLFISNSEKLYYRKVFINKLPSQNYNNDMINANTKSKKNLEKLYNINRFIIMCTEQYAVSVNQPSDVVYRNMNEHGVIDDLTNDYEDLHGMSTVYLNDYINLVINGKKVENSNIEIKEHQLAKFILITKVTELIAEEYRISISKARDMLYNSNVIKLIDDDETGLYGESPLYVFSLFQKEQKNSQIQ